MEMEGGRQGWDSLVVITVVWTKENSDWVSITQMCALIQREEMTWEGRGVYGMMCMVLKRVEIENIIGHCLIVLRGNTQEKTEYEFIIRGGWEGRDESEKEGTY